MNKTCWMIDGDIDRDDFVVVLPACDKDCQILLRNLDWMRRMDGKLDYTCVVSQDKGMNTLLAREVLESAQATFDECLHYVYPEPKMPRWPNAPNWAFQHSALYVYTELNRPWFWMEPDLVPVRSGWLPILQNEYSECGMPIMGSVVEGRLHLNGTAIYPANFPEVSPAAMAATDVAWDWVMKEETMPHAHDAGHLMYHCWGIENDKPHPYNGPAASFTSQDQVDRWVPKTAVTFHRCKDASLIQRLIERKNLNESRHTNSHLRERPSVPAV